MVLWIYLLVDFVLKNIQIFKFTNFIHNLKQDKKDMGNCCGLLQSESDGCQEHQLQGHQQPDRVDFN